MNDSQWSTTNATTTTDGGRGGVSMVCGSGLDGESITGVGYVYVIRFMNAQLAQWLKEMRE
jgi:hypothetical protein